MYMYIHSWKAFRAGCVFTSGPYNPNTEPVLNVKPSNIVAYHTNQNKTNKYNSSNNDDNKRIRSISDDAYYAYI